MKAAFIIVYFSIFIAALTMAINPLGISQRIFWGMHPPYHWESEDVARNSAGSVNERYIDAKGKECASVYRFAFLNDDFKVYGFGFSQNRPTREEAEEIAEKECR